MGISLHNFPEGIVTYVTASSDIELGMGIALAVALHNIPEGLAVAGPVYAATGSKSKAILWAGVSGITEMLGCAVWYGGHGAQSDSAAKQRSQLTNVARQSQRPCWFCARRNKSITGHRE